MIHAKIKEPLKIIKYVKNKFDIDLNNTENDKIVDIYKKCIYLFNKDIKFDIENVDMLYYECKKTLKKKGDEKKKQKHIERDIFLIEIGKNKICNHCNNVYITKNNKSNRNGFCSIECNRKSGSVHFKIQKSYLKNKSIDISNLSDSEIDILYKQQKSIETKKSNPKRVQTIKEKYENGFSEICKKGSDNHKFNFLLENNLIQNNKTYDKRYIDVLYKKYFDKITKHGKKVRDGIIKKHGEKYKEIIHQRLINFYVCALKEKGVDIESFIINDIQKLYRKIFGKQQNKILFKYTHLINSNLENLENISDTDIKILYSEYLSNRKISLCDNIHNGYKKTLKGWFIFNNNKELFYRSSWELYVFNIINELINDKIIIDIKTPERIKYYYMYNRHYYPDIHIEYQDNSYKIIEIKPKSKLLEEMNIQKIKAAQEIYGDIFCVITEDDIFNLNFKEKMKNKEL